MSTIGVHGGAGGGTASDPSEVNIIQYGSTATSLGQKASSASIPVVLPSDALPPPDRTISGTITTTTPENVALNPYGSGSSVVLITGTWTGTLSFIVSVNGGISTNTIRGRNVSTGLLETQTPGNGTWIFPTAGWSVLGVSGPTSTGTANVIINCGTESTTVSLAESLPIGTNSIGAVTANAGTNLNTSALALETTQAAQMSRADTFKTRADTFTSTGNGVTIDASASPVSAFGIQVKGTGAGATSWDIRLEGSLNNVDFTAVLQHTQVTGDGVVTWTGASQAPSLYFRARVAGLVLGGATNIVVTILGKN